MSNNFPTSHKISFSGTVEVEITGTYDIEEFKNLLRGSEHLDLSDNYDLHNFMYDALNETLVDTASITTWGFSADDLTYQLDNGKEVDFEDLVKGIAELLEEKPKIHKYHERQTTFDI